MPKLNAVIWNMGFICFMILIGTVLCQGETVTPEHFFSRFALLRKDNAIQIIAEGSSKTFANAFLLKSNESLVLGEWHDCELAEDIKVYSKDNNTIYAYIASGYDGIYVLDVTNPIEPVQKYQYDYDILYIRKLFIYKGYLFATNYTQGVKVYKIMSDALAFITNINIISGFIYDIVVQDNVLYAVLDQGRVEIIPLTFNTENVIQPDSDSTPHQILTMDQNQFIYHIFISDNQVACASVLNQQFLIQADATNHKEMIFVENTKGYMYPNKMVSHKAAYTIHENLDQKQLMLKDIDQNPDQAIYVFPFNDVRDYDIFEEFIYIANGFDGIAVVYKLVEAKTFTYNATHQTMQIFFQTNEDERVKNKILLYDNHNTFQIEDFIIDQVDVIKSNGKVVIIINENADFSSLTLINKSGEIVSCQKSIDSEGKTNFNCIGLSQGVPYSIYLEIDGKAEFMDTVRVKSFDFEIKPLDVSKFMASTQKKQTLTLYSGWNLISLPITPNDNDLKLLQDLNDYKTFYYYGKGVYQTTDTPEPGKGYWINVNNSKDNKNEVSLKGDNFVSYTQHLTAGWHLVGSVNGETIQITCNPVIDDKGNPVLEQMVYFNPFKLSYEQIKDNRVPIGYGFWIHLLKDSEVTISINDNK